MKKNKLFYITLVISFIPLLINIIAYPHMPNRVPVHWGINGEVNQYGSKVEQVSMSALPLVLFIFLNYLPAIDPKRESYKKHGFAFSVINLMIIIVISCINLAGLLSAFGYPISFQKVLAVLFGLMFLVLGNYMSQIRHNYFFGIRTPWTLASEYVWKKTHRFGGYMYILVGLVAFVSIFIGPAGLTMFFVALLIGTAATILYSYLVFKKNI
ncbi:SdpI family protein [Bacillus sp. BRMEA1]|uniref:SdpI family protein n=1 Tax=Neobacillus endophyticus TaxID=2738405 RepID=UPI00156374C7|nr:SdpI family protein [Neobacillus endophyticus]NRD77746.1 SdpI family protein [Neobacillus endophyticus]